MENKFTDSELIAILHNAIKDILERAWHLTEHGKLEPKEYLRGHDDAVLFIAKELKIDTDD
jgi:hypothetical protein